MATVPGTVYLVGAVGAGPGASGLITVEGVRCLRKADVVVYDSTAHAGLLDYAPPEAERLLMSLPERQDGVDVSQSEALLVERARSGRTVVRLRSDDGLSSGGAEAEALAAAGVPFEIVPGVNPAIAVAAYAGIPLLHRELSSSFTVADCAAAPAGSRRWVHWAALVRDGGTVLFPLKVADLRDVVRRLAGQGMSGDTLAALTCCGPAAHHTTVVATVDGIADRIQGQDPGAQAVLIVGEVVRLREKLRWLERKPLFGLRIVVTRPRAQAADFIDRLAGAGADVVPCPAIEIVPPDSWQPLDEAIGRIETFDWLVFTSINGVESFFARLLFLGRDVRCLSRARIAAVGPQTARALGERGLLVDVVPEEFRAEAVAEGMRRAGIDGARVLLPRAARAREILPAMLRESGAQVEEVTSYKTVAASGDAAVVRKLLAERSVDLVTFTSSSTVRNFLDLLGENAVALLQSTRIGCIGPITADTARAAGLAVHIQPSAYTVAAFADEIIRYFKDLPKKDVT